MPGGGGSGILGPSSALAMHMGADTHCAAAGGQVCTPGFGQWLQPWPSVMLLETFTTSATRAPVDKESY